MTDITERERFDIHAALGFAKRQARRQWSPHPPEDYAESVQNAINTLYRLGIWTVEELCR